MREMKIRVKVKGDLSTAVTVGAPRKGNDEEGGEGDELRHTHRVDKRAEWRTEHEADPRSLRTCMGAGSLLPSGLAFTS